MCLQQGPGLIALSYSNDLVSSVSIIFSILKTSLFLCFGCTIDSTSNGLNLKIHNSSCCNNLSASTGSTLMFENTSHSVSAVHGLIVLWCLRLNTDAACCSARQLWSGRLVPFGFCFQ